MTSKKRDSSRPPNQPPITFYLDRCAASESLFQALRCAGVKVERHQDHFAHDEKDPVWLTAVGQYNWVVITADKNIRRNELERTAFIAASLRVFCLTKGNRKGEEVAKLFVACLPEMIRIANSRTPPFWASVGGSGIKILGI